MRSSYFSGSGVAATFCLLAVSANRVDAQGSPQGTTPSNDPASAVLSACYLPVAGVPYLIKQPGLLRACLTVRGIQHSEIFWNQEGPKGDRGPAGSAGPPGANGPVGDKGPTGPAGTQGPTGNQGPPGDKGAPGAAGATGDKGPTGDKGLNGAAGAPGDQGPAGDKGPPGTQGPAGNQGPTGDQGAPGEKGPVGDKGPTGDLGPVGEQGAAGERGLVGDKGPIGEKGATGDSGPTGERGPTGRLLPCDNGCVTTPMIADLAVTNAKLATITVPGKIANSATTATTAAIVNRIVARSAVGAFEVGNTNTGSLTLSALRLGPSSVISHAGSSIIVREGSGAPVVASVFAGPSAGGGASGTNENTGVGSRSLLHATQSGNTAAGIASVDEPGGFGGPSGIGNTAVGMRTIERARTNGGFNVAIGRRAGRFISSARNILIGFDNGNNLSTGSNNLYIVGNAAPGNESQTLRIGHGAQTRAFVAGIDNSVVDGVAVHVDNTTGQLGVLTSSARYKIDVRDVGDASATLARLHPVSYRYRPDLDAGATLQYGLIAEEVDRLMPDLMVRDSAGRPYTVRYDMLVPLLVNEVQRRTMRLAALRHESAALLRRLEQLEAAGKP